MWSEKKHRLLFELSILCTFTFEQLLSLLRSSPRVVGHSFFRHSSEKKVLVELSSLSNKTIRYRFF